MRRPTVALLLAVVAFGLLWRPLIYPAAKAALLLLDIYSPSLLGTNVAAVLTPEPRVEETRGTLGGVEMRVTWWRPGWGDRHPAVMIVNGATPVGNDNTATRQFGSSLARAGYLVMLPEFPFLKEGRLDPDGPRVVDAAFARLRASPETTGRPVGAFGASVGAGLMLVAAASEVGLSRADFLAVLGGYYDLDTYVASIAAGEQVLPGTGLGPWVPSEEAKQRVPPALEAAMHDLSDRERARQVFAAGTYNEALTVVGSLSPSGRIVVDRLSPARVWSAIRPPIYWLHDPDDSYEPLAEAEAARLAPRDGHMTLLVPRLLQHAEVSPGAAARGPLFVAGELWGLLTFTLDVLRLAG